MMEYRNVGRSFGCFDLNPIIPPFQYSSWVAGSARIGIMRKIKITTFSVLKGHDCRLTTPYGWRTVTQTLAKYA